MSSGGLFVPCDLNKIPQMSLLPPPPLPRVWGGLKVRLSANSQLSLPQGLFLGGMPLTCSVSYSLLFKNIFFLTAITTTRNYWHTSYQASVSLADPWEALGGVLKGMTSESPGWSSPCCSAPISHLLSLFADLHQVHHVLLCPLGLPYRCRTQASLKLGCQLAANPLEIHVGWLHAQALRSDVWAEKVGKGEKGQPGGRKPSRAGCDHLSLWCQSKHPGSGTQGRGRGWGWRFKSLVVIKGSLQPGERTHLLGASALWPPGPGTRLAFMLLPPFAWPAPGFLWKSFHVPWAALGALLTCRRSKANVLSFLRLLLRRLAWGPSIPVTTLLWFSPSQLIDLDLVLRDPACRYWSLLGTLFWQGRVGRLKTIYFSSSGMWSLGLLSSALGHQEGLAWPIGISNTRPSGECGIVVWKGRLREVKTLAWGCAANWVRGKIWTQMCLTWCWVLFSTGFIQPHTPILEEGRRVSGTGEELVGWTASWCWLSWGLWGE